MSLVKALGATAAFATDRAGRVASYLYQSRETLAFFRQIINAIDKAYSDARATTPVSVTASPMTYTAAERVSLHVAGGIITGLSFKRAGTSLALATTSAGLMVPLNPGDQLEITYSAAPTITEVPR